jgi:lipid A 3-O-deacylase
MSCLTPARRILGLLVFVIVSTGEPVCAADAERIRTLAFGTGWFDFNRQRDEALEARIEYRVGRPRFPLRAIATATFTGDSSVFVGAGIAYQVDLGRRWTVTPAFVPGYYRRGNGKDLGFPLEFRSQLEIGYGLPRGSRVAIAVSHLSNGSLGSRNPGQESLTVACEIPLARRHLRSRTLAAPAERVRNR